ncbi:MAG: hypothetical protein L6R48_17545 [Planctomycetes bacterium]|nr:hypothetical protein [Planctomycetota bacterium]
MGLPCTATLLLLALAGAAPVALPATEATGAVAGDAGRELAAIDALLDQAVQLGFPEGRGATAWSGTLSLTFQGSAAAFAGVRRRIGHLFRAVSADQDQAEANGEVTGVHLRLADGTWLVRLTTPVAASEGLTVACDGAQAVPLALVCAREPGDRVEDESASIGKRLPPADAETYRRLTALYPALASRSSPLGSLLLMRAGHPAGSDLLRLEAMRAVLEPPPGKALDAPLDLRPRSRSGCWFGRRRGFAGGGDQPLAPAESTAVVQRLLRRWAVTRLIQADDAGRPAALAAARALAGGDPAEVANLLRIAAGLALPAKPAVDAALSARLAVWRPDDEQGSSFDPLGLAAGDDGLGESLRQGRRQGHPLVGERDAGALVRLLDDGRPSRWIDQGVARTLGDSALSALAELIGNDPRELAGLTIAPRWDAAERKVCADALAAWWTGHGASVAGVLDGAVAELPLGRALNLVQQRHGPQQRRLGATLGRRLAARPPALAELEGQLSLLARVAVAMEEVPELRQGIERLPTAPGTAVFLAVWQDRHGDPGPLSALIDAGLAGAGDTGAALTACGLRPEAHRFTAAVALLERDQDHEAFRTAAAVALGAWSQRDQDGALRMLLRANPAQEQRDGSHALRLALARRLLADQRPLPAGMVTLVDGDLRAALGPDHHLTLSTHGWQKEGTGTVTVIQPAADLRWCDLAALALEDRRRGVDPSSDQPMDPTAAIEDRDRALDLLRAKVDELATTALVDAGLGDPASTGAAEALY